MRAAGALPTEERCKQMTNAQWLWYYFNLEEDMIEERDKAQNHYDYLGMYINPKLAKAVAEHNKKSKQSSQETKSTRTQYIKDILENKKIDSGAVSEDTIESTEFEKELAKALKDSGATADDIVELGDDNSAGDAYESESDFLERVKAFAPFAGTNYGYVKPQKPAKAIIKYSTRAAKPNLQDGEYLPPQYEDNANQEENKLQTIIKEQKEHGIKSSDDFIIEKKSDLPEYNGLNTNDNINPEKNMPSEDNESYDDNSYDDNPPHKDNSHKDDFHRNDSRKGSIQEVNQVDLEEWAKQIQTSMLNNRSFDTQVDSSMFGNESSFTIPTESGMGHLPPEGLTDDMDYFDYDDDN